MGAAGHGLCRRLGRHLKKKKKGTPIVFQRLCFSPWPPSTDAYLLRMNPSFMTSLTSSTNVITDAYITPENAEAHPDVSRSASFSVSGVASNNADAIATPIPTPSCCSKEDESSSDSGGRSFLSWTKSRRSVEYIQSEKYHELLQQKQETPEEAPFQCTHHSSMQLYQQLQRLSPAKDPYYQSMDNPAAESPRSRMHQSYRTAPRHPNNRPITEALRN